MVIRRVIRDVVRVVDKSIDMVAGIFHFGMKLLGPCFICLAHCLIGFVTYTYLVHALPNMDVGGILGEMLVTALGGFFLLNLLFNYWHAMCLDPGLPPDYKEVLELGEESDAPRPKQCLKCNRQKPPRTHHCSICNRCVLKMDHHCPWIGNCVGFGNYRYFCLFMFFLTLGCSYIIVVFATCFPDIILHMRGRGRSRGTLEGRECIFMSFMICCSILLALCCLGGFHIFLVLTNQTTIEFQTNLLRWRAARKKGETFRNPYHLGFSRNFQQVFGPNPFCRMQWMMPYLAIPPHGDGIDYPSLRVRVV